MSDGKDAVEPILEELVVVVAEAEVDVAVVNKDAVEFASLGIANWHTGTVWTVGVLELVLITMLTLRSRASCSFLCLDSFLDFEPDLLLGRCFLPAISPGSLEPKLLLLYFQIRTIYFSLFLRFWKFILPSD